MLFRSLIPLFSILALAAFGYADLTPRLLWATIFILVAAVIPVVMSKLAKQAVPLEIELKIHI